jgi:hypothetical protein
MHVYGSIDRGVPWLEDSRQGCLTKFLLLQSPSIMHVRSRTQRLQAAPRRSIVI